MNVLEEIVYRALDEVRDLVDDPESLVESPHTKLIGTGAVMDSVTFVSFLVAVENTIEDQLDVRVTLANEKAMSRTRSPFLTLATLAEYATELLRQEGINV